MTTQARPASPRIRRIPSFPARHGFTLRHPGSVELSRSKGARTPAGPVEADAGTTPASLEREVLAEALGVAPERLRRVHQVHGDRVVDMTRIPTADAHERSASGGSSATGLVAEPPEGDALMSGDPRDGLAVVTADCLPILFWDARTGAAAAAHCGWKGTRLRLAERVVQAMTLRFGSRAGDLWVGIGPGIAGGCYQVGEEVIEAFRTAGFSGSVARPDLEGRWRLDLVAANREALRGAGVHEDRILVDGACTHCDAERFYSYRRDMTSRRHWAGVRPGPR